MSASISISNITSSSVDVSVNPGQSSACKVGIYYYKYSSSTYSLYNTYTVSAGGTLSKTLTGFIGGAYTKIQARIYNYSETSQLDTATSSYFYFKCKLTYDINGGSGETPDTTETSKISSSGTSITLDSGGNFSKSGQVLDYWSVYDVYSGTTTNVSPGGSYTITHNCKATAVWKSSQYQVTYVYGDNQRVMPSSTTYYTFGYSFTTLGNDTFTRTGYSYSQWYCALTNSNYNTSTLISIPSSYSSYDNFAFSPVWTANTYTVTFDYNYSGGGSTTKSETYGSTYDLPTSPSRTGYTFGGWWTSSSGGSQITSTSTVDITSNTTLYAHWTGNTYTVKYYNDSILYKTYTNVSQGASLSTVWPADPTKTGYKFTGWYTLGGTSGTQVSSTETVTGDRNIYSHWEVNSYPLTLSVGAGISAIYYKINGASSYSSTSSSFNTTAKYDTTIYCYATAQNYYNTPTYTSTNVWSQAVSTSGNTFTASTTLKTYNLKYNGNGNTGGTVPSTKTWQYGQQGLVVGSTDLYKTGYTRNGWNTRSDGGETSYSDTSIITFEPNSSDITLYARWDANKYTVSFDVNGGTGSVNSIEVTYDSTYSNLPSGSGLSKTGYTFNGWWTSSSGGSQITSTSTVAITSNTTLYAHWSPTNYTVVYNGNGATGGSTESSQHTYGVSQNLTLNGYTRTGYYFVGWATSPTGQAIYSDGQSVVNLSSDSGTVNLYAIWEMNKTISVNVNNSWKNIDLNNSIYTNVNGTWKAVNVTDAYVNVNGTWHGININ